MLASDVVTEWSERAARLEYDFGTSRTQAEIAALMRMPRLRSISALIPMGRILEALREAEAGRMQILEEVIDP